MLRGATKNDRAVSYYQLCKWYAIKKGCDDLTSEDFASFAVVHYLANERDNCHWSFVNYWRTTIGRPVNRGKKSPTYKMKLAFRNTIRIKDVPEAYYTPVCRLDFRVLEDEEDADLLILREAYGYSDEELGKRLGISKSRICQRRKIVERRIQIKLRREM